MIGIPLGLATANATEWLVHRYVLHGLGKKKASYWSFHWHQHHKAVRKNGHRDTDYEKSLFSSSSMLKEASGLVAGAVAVAPLFPVAPFFVGTLWYSAANYYVKHKRAHIDPEWARENLSWHYDHHMGPDQNSNWCVTRPWFDQLLGTRKPYVGTERERSDRAKAERLAARKAGLGAGLGARLGAVTEQATGAGAQRPAPATLHPPNTPAAPIRRGARASQAATP